MNDPKLTSVNPVSFNVVSGWFLVKYYSLTFFKVQVFGQMELQLMSMLPQLTKVTIVSINQSLLTSSLVKG